jgi:RNA polymerase sigma-70 factor (sigma-E family)
VSATTLTGGPSTLADPRGAQARSEFEAFFDGHHRELSRLAYLLTGDHWAADDLTADVFLAAWRQWDTVRGADEPLAYVRRVLVNLAATRIRRLTRERRRLPLFHVADEDAGAGPDGASVVDVRTALRALPPRRRACVVLRYALDLPEAEVADMLGISVGTVKSQTSKAVAQLQRCLGPQILGELS